MPYFLVSAMHLAEKSACVYYTYTEAFVIYQMREHVLSKSNRCTFVLKLEPHVCNFEFSLGILQLAFMFFFASAMLVMHRGPKMTHGYFHVHIPIRTRVVIIMGGARSGILLLMT